MLKKYLDYSGSKMFLGIESESKDDIIHNYWSYVNWTADNESKLFILKESSPYFGYFKVIDDKFHYWLKKKNLFKILQDEDYATGNKLGNTEILESHHINSEKLAEHEYQSIKIEPFIGNLLTTFDDFHTVSNVECNF